MKRTFSIRTAALAVVAVAITGPMGVANAADVMARATLERGTILTRADIDIYPAAGEDGNAVATAYLGKQLTRTVYQGHAVTRHHLQEPVIVGRNATVTMVYTTGPLAISTHGRSLGEGAMGEMVEVMNAQSRKKVMAVVTGPDEVRVP